MPHSSEEDMEHLKKQLIQNQLDSLHISIENLAKGIGHVPADIIARSCLAIMKSMSSLAYGCVMENIDRYDESRLQQVCEEIQALTCSFAEDDEDGRNDPEAMQLFDKPHLKDELRDEPPDVKVNTLLSILEKGNAMTVEFRGPPYDYAVIFIAQAKWILASFIEELKYHYRSPPAISSEDDDVFSATLPLLAQPINAHYERWIKKQVADHEQYLRLPVQDDVACVALRTYKDCQVLVFPCPQGLALHALSPSGTEAGWRVQQAEIPSELSSPPWGNNRGYHDDSRTAARSLSRSRI
ncbi:uncharacterized protein FMAN_14476 [Fusarium mangiferae]|uniref:Uncharacterized protein n=1 Tax=Fusarium mangiferae TaxID=192010 RepID=A0A1L7UIL5_FUSMA|nr:uncharacterized protein FMAN_14476 [Fusarium mangiferae]CVL07597.1 uncharacterized protein FMAN_14476 [Fusarium mangiferae]